MDVRNSSYLFNSDRIFDFDFLMKKQELYIFFLYRIINLILIVAYDSF